MNATRKNAFTSEGLENFVNNDARLYNQVVSAVKTLRRIGNQAADKLAKENAAWHDDEAADDHAAYHAPAAEQYPREVRDQAIRDLVAYYLNELKPEVD